MEITPGADKLATTHPQHAHTDRLLDLKHLRFPQFKHEHPKVQNVNEVVDEKLTLGQKVADGVANVMGSWRFIISQATIMIIWITLNVVGWFYHFDVYPFVLLNLAMSAQAAFATPLIMMSQNRQAEKDRLTAQNDYLTDCKGEEEIRHIMEHLDHQDELILQIVKRLEEQHQAMLARLTELDPEMARKISEARPQTSLDGSANV
jgi:uncharacterized membrane protein